MPRLTKNFHSNEFVCPCCGQAEIDQKSIERLQMLREVYGKPLGIVEGGGYRCDLYGGAGYSAHKEGKAFDLSYPKADHYELVMLAFNMGFTGIGDKNKDGKFQLHIDDAEPIPGKRHRPVKWSY